MVDRRSRAACKSFFDVEIAIFKFPAQEICLILDLKNDHNKTTREKKVKISLLFRLVRDYK